MSDIDGEEQVEPAPDFDEVRSWLDSGWELTSDIDRIMSALSGIIIAIREQNIVLYELMQKEVGNVDQ
jgi:hypothetical protein